MGLNSDKPVQCPLSSFHTDLDPKEDPQMFAWALFAYVNQSVPNTESGPTVLWETWASPRDLYCSKDRTNCDPDNNPQWPAFKGHALNLGPITQIEMLANSNAVMPSPDTAPGVSLVGQELRMNCPTFKHISDNNLWYLEGQEKAFESGKEVVFPIDAIEIKAYWISVDEDVKSRYHWQKVGSRYYGLVSLSITSRVLPRWFWATFEHVDNPNRCIAPKTCREYTSGSGNIDPGVASKVRSVLRGNGLTEPWWLNYRLDGTQFTFTDENGLPTVLANSIFESLLISRTSNTSSCITCHARATVDYQGNRLCAGRDNTGNVGEPLRAWYCDSSGHMKFLPLGFVWSLREAQSIHSTVDENPKKCDNHAPIRVTGPQCVSIPFLAIN